MRYTKMLEFNDNDILEPLTINGKVSSKDEAYVTMLLDTGCTNTIISSRIADTIKATVSNDNIPVATATGSSVEGTCHIDLYAYSENGTHLFGLKDMKVLVSKNMPMDVLIGMDVISQGDFSLTRRLDKVMLEFFF